MFTISELLSPNTLTLLTSVKHSYGISAYTVEIRAVWKTVHILLNVHAGRGIEFLQMMYLTDVVHSHTYSAHKHVNTFLDRMFMRTFGYQR